MAVTAPRRSRRLPSLLACSLALLVASSAAAQEGGAAAPAGGCVTADCHAGVAADGKHEGKKIACAGCHPNVKGGEPHKGALDETPPEKMCAQSGCHPDQTARQRKGAHKESVCDSCHGSVHDGFTRADYSSCKSCHGEQLKGVQASAHASAKKPVGCPDCHGDLHAPTPRTDPASPVAKVAQVATCGRCHDNEHVRGFSTSVHGRGLLRSGLAVAPTCSDCHGAHAVLGVKSEAAAVSRKNVVQTCGKCHTFLAAQWRSSAHGQRWVEEQAGKAAKDAPTAGQPQAPVCTDCHAGHLAVDPRVDGNHLAMADLCGRCHKEQSETYRDTFHGKATRLGMRAAATCADCHTAHAMLPTTDPASSVHPKSLGRTCGRCHANVNAGFLQFNPHLDPSSKKAPAVLRWSWLFMTALLFAVMAFFAVHATLWLQRTIVAFARKEIHRPPRTGEVWVRRFRPVHVTLHVVVVVSFLLLAATGLPLKLSGFAWVRPLSALLGGPEVARWLHRVGAIVTFGYSLFYAGYLLREIVLRRRRALLWGWQSMVPRPQDFIDLFRNLRWFLYLGPQPKLDRWSYWEKFDFFAVFWGVPVIGLSGLVLWAPAWFTSFLPGWVVNLAYLVHSDEALLATGFIFLFHFFHTHLRPESFPLDTVIFLGKMPLSRLEEERPAEHARLVASGELDALLTSPPTDRQVRRALWFGGVALAVGALLGAMLLSVAFRVLWGYLAG